MKHFKRQLLRTASGLAAGLMLIGAVGSIRTFAGEGTQNTGTDSYWHGEKTYRDIWTPSSDESRYPNHRIPGIVVTKKIQSSYTVRLGREIPNGHSKTTVTGA